MRYLRGVISVFRFIHAHCALGDNLFEIPVSVVAGECNRGGGVRIDMVDDELR